MIVGHVAPTMPGDQLYVFGLAHRHANWASTRQAAIAGNIANADTPGYRARDIAAFETEMNKTRLQMAATRPQHLELTESQMQAEDIGKAGAWEVTHSSNTVSLDEQLMKADETARAHQLDMSVIGTFHRMLLSSVSFR